MKKYNSISVSEYLKNPSMESNLVTNSNFIITNFSAKKKAEKEMIEFIKSHE